MIAGTPLTIRIGLIAGLIGVGLGTVLAFVSAYYGGVVDAVVRGVVDVGLTIPGLLVLIILAVTIREGISVNQMALVVACLAWLYPTRVIRAQVLSMRERTWVQVARLSGMSGPEIIVKEMLPNLSPTWRRHWSTACRPPCWPRSASKRLVSARSSRRPWG